MSLIRYLAEYIPQAEEPTPTVQVYAYMRFAVVGGAQIDASVSMPTVILLPAGNAQISATASTGDIHVEVIPRN